MIKVGLLGYGKAGQAVAEVLKADDRFGLAWVARAHANDPDERIPGTDVPVVGLNQVPLPDLLDAYPVDAMIDFSKPEAVLSYGEEVRQRGIMLVSAISAYTDEQLAYIKGLGASTRVLSSPNMTIGINFLILAARLLRRIAPFADVEILEQHFRDKPEVSGTARKIAESLSLEDERITSLRLGGIVGYHEVIFGFPYQTVRITHESIKREAFGTGAAFALSQLSSCDNGFYTFEDLMMRNVREQLQDVAPA